MILFVILVVVRSCYDSTRRARLSISSILAGHLEIGCSVNSSTCARYLMLIEMLELPFLVMCRFADAILFKFGFCQNNMQYIWCGHFLNAWPFGGNACDINATLVMTTDAFMLEILWCILKPIQTLVINCQDDDGLCRPLFVLLILCQAYVQTKHS